MFDIVFISYNEPNADKNWQNLKKRFPTAQRIHGIKGIHEAHMIAATKSWTKMFWVVDGDAEIKDDFDFSYFPKENEELWSGIKAVDTVHVWSSENPVNGLVYGYGGVKLLPKMATLDMDLTSPDMTTSISSNFKAMPEISNVTAFDTDEFSTWRSAFRECVKLASKTITGQNNEETDQRLEGWLNPRRSSSFYVWAKDGATRGRDYGLANANNPDSLRLINNFDWLKEQFESVN
jgi:hypothetical protein